MATIRFCSFPHLPLKGDIPTLNVQRFLRNFLPEGNALDELMSYFQISKSNTFGLIQALGLDMPGALIIIPEEQKAPKNHFRIIPDDELKGRLDKREDFSLIIWDGKPRLSVAGVQDKINVMLNKTGQLGFGEGSLCSTHILKFEKQKLSHLVLNEYLTMQLAKACGISVANVKMLYFGTHPALLVERFDRQLVSASQVKRRHLIDGCQALNLPPEYKYERNYGSGRDVAHIRDGASYAGLFAFANTCINPALTKQKILDWALFNVLVFNHDAHGKNISFFVGSSGIALSPFYDLVNIKMYPDFEQHMAMAMGMGDEFESDVIHAYQLADFAEQCHIPRSFLAKRLEMLITKLQSALDEPVDLVIKTKDQNTYVKKYYSLIKKRSEYLLTQIEEITAIKL